MERIQDARFKKRRRQLQLADRARRGDGGRREQHKPRLGKRRFILKFVCVCVKYSDEVLSRQSPFDLLCGGQGGGSWQGENREGGEREGKLEAHEGRRGRPGCAVEGRGGERSARDARGGRRRREPGEAEGPPSRARQNQGGAVGAPKGAERFEVSGVASGGVGQVDGARSLWKEVQQCRRSGRRRGAQEQACGERQGHQRAAGPSWCL